MGVKGNMVTLEVTFRDENGDPVAPDGDVTLTVVDSVGTELDSVTILKAAAVSTGKYQHDFVLPDVEAIDHEWSAVVGGKVELGRQRVPVVEYTE